MCCKTTNICERNLIILIITYAKVFIITQGRPRFVSLVDQTAGIPALKMHSIFFMRSSPYFVEYRYLQLRTCIVGYG